MSVRKKNAIPFARKHREVSKAAQALQEALRAAFAELLDGDVGGRSVARRLGVDKMLGWKAHRIATAPDPATIVAALPGERGMATLIEGLARAGASGTLFGQRRAWSTRAISRAFCEVKR